MYWKTTEQNASSHASQSSIPVMVRLACLLFFHASNLLFGASNYEHTELRPRAMSSPDAGARETDSLTERQTKETERHIQGQRGTDSDFRIWVLTLCKLSD